jgi:hypothetical protein
MSIKRVYMRQAGMSILLSWIACQMMVGKIKSYTPPTAYIGILPLIPMQADV